MGCAAIAGYSMQGHAKGYLATLRVYGGVARAAMYKSLKDGCINEYKFNTE